MIAALILLAGTPAAGETLTLQDSAGKHEVGLERIRDVRVSKGCAPSACEAGRHARRRRPRAEPATSEQGTALPAHSVLCQKLTGRVVILEDAKLDQFDFCRFSDGSLLSLDDLELGNEN